MTRFIQQSACRGSRPSGIAPARQASRPRLVSRLLRDRRVARCLVAPAGYGKAAVACEYAEVVFGFQHVFWINGTSPCFLRDLDAGVLAAGVLEGDEEAALAVLSGLPVLDEGRAEALSAALDELLAAGCEVVITAVPAADCLGSLQRDRMVVGAADLLVDEDEARDDALTPSLPGAVLSLDARVPCLRWGEEGQADLARGIVREELVADMRLALWAMLVMGRGDLDDVAAVIGDARAQEAWRFLAAHYPHAGIDRAAGSFCAVEMDLSVLRAATASSLDEAARAQGLEGLDALTVLVADRMMARGLVRRAAQAMGAFAGRPTVSRWLGRVGWELVWGGAGAEMGELYQSVCHIRVDERAQVNAMMAWASAFDGDGRAAIEFARKAIGSSYASDALRAAAALAAYGRGNAATRRAMAEPVERWLGHSGEEQGSGAVLRLLASVALAHERAADPLAQWRLAMERVALASPMAVADERGCLLGAAWALDAAAARGAFEPGREDMAMVGGADMAALVSFAAERIDRIAASGCLGAGAREAAAALERIDGALSLAGLPGLTERGRRALDADRIRRSRAGFGPGRVPSSRPRRAAVPEPTSPVSSATGLRGGFPALDLAPSPSVPVLRVRLFGAMTVQVGDADVTGALKSRRKARLLLALLVLHRGRELTRERIAALLWPAASSRSGAKNFYRVWGELSQILSVEGRCPYLIRDRYGCRIDAALCTSDIAEFDSLSRQLLFGPASGALAWEHVLFQIQEAFGSPLLPAEGDCEAVDAFRERFATEMVDGLVAASSRLRRSGEPQGALWFAREALRRDRTREDVYAALMRAQMASDQRSAAVDTFFTCRDFLSDSLGLDPSPSLQGLYQSLLEGDCALA